MRHDSCGWLVHAGLNLLSPCNMYLLCTFMFHITSKSPRLTFFLHENLNIPCSILTQCHQQTLGQKKSRKCKKSLNAWILEDLAINLTPGQSIPFQSNIQPSRFLPTTNFSVFSLVNNFLVGTTASIYTQFL